MARAQVHNRLLAVDHVVQAQMPGQMSEASLLKLLAHLCGAEIATPLARLKPIYHALHCVILPSANRVGSTAKVYSF
jgi:hypothetical protein